MMDLLHEDSLNRLGLYLLEFRKAKGDLIRTYKSLEGFKRLDAGRMFHLTEGYWTWDIVSE